MDGVVGEAIDPLDLQPAEYVGAIAGIANQILEDLAQRRDHLVGALAIVHGDVDGVIAEAARLIADGGHGAEGDAVQRAVAGAKFQGADRHPLHRAADAVDRDGIADIDRILEQDEGPGDHVLDQGLGTEADGETDHPGAGQQRGDVDAELRQDGEAGQHGDDDEQRVAHQRQQGARPGAGHDRIAVIVPALEIEGDRGVDDLPDRQSAAQHQQDRRDPPDDLARRPHRPG